MNNLLMSLLFLTFLTSCSILMDDRPEYIKAAYNVMDKHIKTHKMLGYKVLGTGGSMTKDVENLFINYISNVEADICEARKLLVENVESILTLSNSDPRLLPYMHCYPFTNENVTIVISFLDKEQNIQLPPNMASVSNINGKIYYTYFRGYNTSLQTAFEEDYLEARKIVLGY